MTEEERLSEWWIKVHLAKHGPYPDRGSAFNAARSAKQANPDLHVAVIDPRGLSTPVE
jgi:hypothetical protein